MRYIPEVECYRVEISLCDRRTTTYFATKDLAELAAKWAYRNRLEELQTLPLATNIEPRPMGTGDTLKIVWWEKQVRPEPGQRGPLGFIPHKEYFSYHPYTFESVVIVD